MPNSYIYSGFRYPSEIISDAVWLYFRFSLSFRDVEEMLASRGIIVTYETIRQWTLKFGQTCANTLRRKQAKRGDKWLLDEVAGPFARDERAPAVESGLGGGGCHLRVGRATVGHAGEGRACRRV